MAVRPFDPRLLRLLSFLTRRQAWLTPPEIVRDFRPGSRRLGLRTVQRWLGSLRETGAFVYYPYPRANALGLQDVLVRVRGVRNPGIFGILPFASSFNVEAGLGDGVPFVSQGYWVPGSAMAAFQDYWRAARDLGLAERVEIFQSRNTHYLYSPFERVIQADGTVEVPAAVDNEYFTALARRHLREPFEVRLGDLYRRSPLVIPVVIEHIWGYHSSHQVWEAIRAKGVEHIHSYGKEALARALRKPGAALRLLQQQWAGIVVRFDEAFLQPRIAFDWTALGNAMFVSFLLTPGSTERTVEVAARASERSVYVALRPGVGYDERCHLSCLIPGEQLLPLLEMAREFDRGHEPFVGALMNRAETLKLFQPEYCRLDWRLFDPETLTWRFDGDACVGRLTSLRA